MKTKIFLFLLLGILSGARGQSPFDLTFTAVDNAAYVQLDSIRVLNRTQGGENTIYWPDTSLSVNINPGDLLLYVGYATFSTTGISEVSDRLSSFEVYENFPNPFGDQSEISMYIPQEGPVHVMLTDLRGRVVLRTDRQLKGGHHAFRFYPGSGNFYFLTANWNGISRSIKMIATGTQIGKSCRLDYIGSITGKTVLKALSEAKDFTARQSGILHVPQASQTYTFQFATNIPCPGTPTVEYEGQVYNTIQIFSQCWLKENMNVGTMINTTQNQTNNGIKEKYCYKNQPDSCTRYGALYQWDEMMQYNFQEGSRGICPLGWHIPTDEEWKVLEGAADSQYGIGDDTWDYANFRGLDAGSNLKTTGDGYGYYISNGTDRYGFSGMPGGYGGWGGSSNAGSYGYWWTSTESETNYAWNRYLFCNNKQVYRNINTEDTGNSVRCLKGY